MYEIYNLHNKILYLSYMEKEKNPIKIFYCKEISCKVINGISETVLKQLVISCMLYDKEN